MNFDNVIIFIKSLWNNKDKNHYCCNIFLEKGLNESLKKISFCIIGFYIMIELTFLKELILIRNVNQKSAIFFTIGIFLTKGLGFNHIYARNATIY